MTQEESKDSKSGLAKNADSKNDKKKIKKKDNVVELMTRVIIRQLPPTMTEQQFIEDVSPLPQYTDFYYVNGDLSLGEFAFSRAYFKFKDFEELLIFKDKFDDYVFMDSKGNEFPAIVEYAPLQKMPRRSGDMKLTRQDAKLNTIENDPDYIAFVEELKNSASPSPPPHSADTLLEEIENREVKDGDSKLTPLLEFISKRREEKLKFKEEKQRKKFEAKKKKVDEKKVVKDKDNKIKEQPSQNKPNQPKQGKSPEKKEEKKTKTDATYIIKVNTEEKRTKPSKPSEQTVIDKESKPSTDEKFDKDAKGARIRNKDRPAREIYRPGTKPKPHAQNSNDQESSSSTKLLPKDGNSIDLSEKKTTTTSNTNTKGNQQQSQQYKFKNRVFTRTAKN